MTRIRYVEIENFKTFAKRVHIDLGHPAVLIGPNNAGKTSVIQALSLWSRGVKSWYEKKGAPRKKETRERFSTGINRLNILDVPVSESRFFWNGTRVRKGNTPIEMTINVGIEIAGMTKDCRLIFTYRNPEVIYCKPCSETVQDDDLLRFAAQMDFHLLYPMSGIMSGISADTEESPLPDGRINVFLGQGQTAQVLRNICYKVVENDRDEQTKDWDRIAALVKRIFLVDLREPVFNETRGSLMMTYRQPGVENDLDISLAGRGLQQVLLILAYLYWHKSSLLLVDEPDAHLEILRQKQIYEILNHVAAENDCQVIIATHSEVILDDAVDTNLTLLLHGEAVNLARQQDMKHALRSFGIEHYYTARVHPRILYVEGSTDIEMLRALARKIGHNRAAEVLDGRLNCYYTQNVEAFDSLENRLDRAAGAFGNARAHFHTIKRFVPALQGIALFDGDEQHRRDMVENDLAIAYWRQYELENYFISPAVLSRYVAAQFATTPLLASPLLQKFSAIIDEFLLRDVFHGDRHQLDEFHRVSTGLQRTLLQSVKMSRFAMDVFKKFADDERQPLLLNKGELYKLVEFCPVEEISPEVVEKLDRLVQFLSLPEVV